MKYNVFLIYLLAAAAPSFAQEETLVRQNIESGGFVAPVVRFTEALNELGVMVGGRGGWIINRRVSIGGGGYGLVNSIDAGITDPDTLELGMGYGGLEMEFTSLSDRLAHFTFYTLFGAGRISFQTANDGENDIDGDTFFVVEPIANIELNVTTFFRINLGGGYRFMWNVDTPGIDSEEISGATVSLTFKFGQF